MNRINLLTLAFASALGMLPVALVTPAEAQVDVQIGTMPPPLPPRYGPYGDRDGIPDRYDTYDNSGPGVTATMTAFRTDTTAMTIARCATAMAMACRIVMTEPPTIRTGGDEAA